MSEATDLALLQSSTSMLNNAANIYATDAGNKRDKKWNEQMYERSRRDSLADWNMQNEYNSPTSQMARLRAAGLNPNLVYGKGADNTAGATQQAKYGEMKHRVPNINMDSGIMTYQNAKMMEAQIDNLKVQNTVALQDRLLKAAQTAEVGQRTATGKFELEKSQSLLATSMDMAREELRGKRIGTDIRLQENERAIAMQSKSIEEATARIAKIYAEKANTEEQRKEIRARTAEILKSTELKQLDIDLKKQGIQPHDALWQRIVAEKVKQITDGGINFDSSTDYLIPPWKGNTDSTEKSNNKRRYKFDSSNMNQLQ